MIENVTDRPHCCLVIVKYDRFYVVVTVTIQNDPTLHCQSMA